MNLLEAMVTFLDEVVPTVEVSGPRDLDAAPPSPGPVCIVQAGGDSGNGDSGPEVTLVYSLRFYGDSDDAVLDAYEAVKDGTYTDPRRIFRRTNTLVGGARRLKWATVGSPNGPTLEPDTERRVLFAMLTARWNN